MLYTSKSTFLFKKTVNRYFSQKAGIGIDGFTYCSCLRTIIQHIFSVVEHTNSILHLVTEFCFLFHCFRYCLSVEEV